MNYRISDQEEIAWRSGTSALGDPSNSAGDTLNSSDCPKGVIHTDHLRKANHATVKLLIETVSANVWEKS
jgi:hypothetical protein